MALHSDRSRHTLYFEVGDHEEATNEGTDNFTGGEQKKVSFSSGALPLSPLLFCKAGR